MLAFMTSGLGYCPGRKRTGFCRENGYVKEVGGHCHGSPGNSVRSLAYTSSWEGTCRFSSGAELIEFLWFGSHLVQKHLMGGGFGDWRKDQWSRILVVLAEHCNSTSRTHMVIYNHPQLQLQVIWHPHLTSACTRHNIVLIHTCIYTCIHQARTCTYALICIYMHTFT